MDWLTGIDPCVAHMDELTVFRWLLYTSSRSVGAQTFLNLDVNMEQSSHLTPVSGERGSCHLAKPGCNL